MDLCLPCDPGHQKMAHGQAASRQGTRSFCQKSLVRRRGRPIQANFCSMIKRRQTPPVPRNSEVVTFLDVPDRVNVNRRRKNRITAEQGIPRRCRGLPRGDLCMVPRGGEPDGTRVRRPPACRRTPVSLTHESLRHHRRSGLDGCVCPCQALAHLSPGPLTGASHRGLSPGPLTGASHRGLSPGPLTGASHRGLSPGPLTGASHRGLSPGPLTGASP